MTTPTQLPIPSNNLLDSRFNFEKLDQIVNSDANYYVDRFGKQRLTTAGLQNLINQIGSDFQNNVGLPDGSKFIGTCIDVTTLRSVEPSVDYQRIILKSYHSGWGASSTPPVGGGELYYDPLDKTSDDDGFLIFVTPKGARWKRNLKREYTFEQAGCFGNKINDDSDSLQKALNLQLMGHTITSENSNARYLFSKQLVVYAGEGELNMGLSRLIVDPTKLNSGFAVRVMGDINKTYNAGSKIKLNLQGPYGGDEWSSPPLIVSGTLDGVGIYPGNSTQVSGVVFNDLWIEGFRDCLYIGDKSVYLLQFNNAHLGKFWRYGVHFNCLNDAGENISFNGGVIFNGKNSDNSTSAVYSTPDGHFIDAFFYKTSFDYTDTVFKLNSGSLSFLGCHFENNSLMPYGVITYTSGKRKPQVDLFSVNIDGGNDVAQVGANTGKPAFFLTNGFCRLSADGGSWGKYGKMQSSMVVNSVSGRPQVSIKNIFFDIQGGVDYLDLGNTVSPMRNYNFSTGDLTGWTVDYSVSSGEPVKPTVTFANNPTLGNSVKITGTSTGGGTTTLVGQDIQVHPGRILYLSTKLLWNNLVATSGNGYFGVTWYDIRGNEISHVNVGVNLNTQSSTVTNAVICSGFISVPNGAVKANVGFRHYQMTGDIFMGPVCVFEQ